MPSSNVHQPDGKRDRARHRGRWILIDTGEDRHPRLLSIGNDLYSGTALRTTLDLVARRTILPRVATEVSVQPHSGLVHVDERWWRVEIIPILGVLTHRPAAALAYYGDADRDLPTPPLVGSWEWVITPPGPDQHLRTYWSPDMYRVYGIAEGGQGWWEGPHWLDDLVAVGDRPEMRATFETFIADTEPILRILRITAAPPSGTRYRLRIAGRRFDEDGRVCLRGITVQLHERPVDAQPNHVEALLSLARDPMVMIDPRYELVYLTSARFAELGVVLPTSRHLPSMVHSEDMGLLRTMLRSATAHLGQLQPSLQIRFSGSDGSWRALEVSGTAVRITEHSLHVWCRIRGPVGE